MLRSAMPSYSRALNFSIRALLRFEPMAWRSSSASAGREPGDVDGHLHQLLLEQRHTQRLAERVLQQRMQVGDRLLAVAAADVGMHRPALDGTGTDQRDLDHQVVEAARLQPRQRGHLGPRFDLEHAHRVGAAQHRVDVVLLRDGGQIDLVATVLADEIDGVVQRAEHAETEQIELHQPGSGAVVLVPLQHAALVHPPPLDRADLDHRTVADDHAAGVDAEVARCVFDLGRQLEHGRGDAVIGLVGGGRDVAPRVDLLAPRILLAGRVAERLGHVADRRPRPIGDDVGHLGGVMPAVALVHVLDDLFAAVTFDVDVDVGRAIALGRQEPLEQQTQRHGIGLGDAERVAHRAVGRAAPALAEDVGPVAELDEVPHDQEVAGEPEVLDHVELVVDGRSRPWRAATGPRGRRVARRSGDGHLPRRDDAGTASR